MIDFAKYAFNKSHAACYAVVSYQTAYLKYYYPQEFMAALLTSVLDRVDKISEYILTCRQMGIGILPPDINEGESGFSVSGNAIRYGLSAIKSIGRNVVDAIVRERELNGRFTSLDDFIGRMSGKEINKKTVENFIKAGAMDSLPGNRRQKLLVVPEMMDQKNKERKTSLEGQMSLFDFAAEEDKQNFQITLPNVAEFPREEMLSLEKEVLGVYVTGHPLEEYEEGWRKNITAMTTDFIVDEETDEAKVAEGQFVTIGGMVSGKTVKITKTGKYMAFLTLEDLVGSVEVLVFPKDYEVNRDLLEENAKLFIRGRVSLGDEPAGKLICERIIPFSQIPKELWIQFPDKDAYLASERELLEILKPAEGNDQVIIYLRQEKAKKILPPGWRVQADRQLLAKLSELYGEKNVKVVEKTIEKIGKMN